MQIGYARVSTDDQTLDLQRDALSKARCERVFEETASDAGADRPVLAEVLTYARRGGTHSSSVGSTAWAVPSGT